LCPQLAVDAEETVKADAETHGFSPEREAKLKEEALSLAHMLNHLPKNPFCLHCQRAKLNKKPARSVSFNEADRPKYFGHRTTCDHLISKNDVSQGWDGERFGLFSLTYTQNSLIVSRAGPRMLLSVRIACVSSRVNSS
jgi:hypothetical protein